MAQEENITRQAWIGPRGPDDSSKPASLQGFPGIISLAAQGNLPAAELPLASLVCFRDIFPFLNWEARELKSIRMELKGGGKSQGVSASLEHHLLPT